MYDGFMESKKELLIKLAELRPEVAGELLKNLTFQDKQTVINNEVVNLIPAFDHFELRSNFSLCLDQSVRAQFYYYFSQSGDFKIYEKDGIYVSWIRQEDTYVLIFYVKEDNLLLWQPSTGRRSAWKFADASFGVNISNG